MNGLFIPEMLTPLFYTPLYASLTEAERISYNQLHGQYFLEQTIFFEQLMGQPALAQIIKIAPAEALAQEAREFAQEENQHSEWFREILRELNPSAYAQRDYHLLAVPWLVKWVLRLAARFIAWLPGILWLQLIAEERALYFGRCYLAVAPQLDPRFLTVQKKHLADEPSHIRRDELFLHWLWPRCGPKLRRGNARILRWLLTEFFYLPKRSGWRVVAIWLESHPHLKARQEEFRTAMASLASDRIYLHTLYPRKHLPRTSALSAAWPELAFLHDLFTDDPT